MRKVLFIRLAPWMGVAHPHPQDAPYAYDIAQVIAFFDPSSFDFLFLDGITKSLTIEMVIEKIKTYKPDTLALTVTSSARLYAEDIFKRTREKFPDIFIVAFGQHAHYNPETFLNDFLQVDACIHGECDITLVELITKRPLAVYEKAEIKGIYFWNNGIIKTEQRDMTFDLDQWPMPLYEIFKGYDYRVVSLNFPVFRRLKAGWILASRGCPYQCTICSPAIRRSFGNKLRKSSPKRVADTFELLSVKLGVNVVIFGDDTFTMDMEWAEEVCDELISRKNKIIWAMSTRVDRLSTPLIKKMKTAGLRSAAVGVESGSERILQEINKNITKDQIEWAVSQFKENGISLNVTVIVGHVNETVDELNETFAFLKKIDPFFVQLHYLTPYPGTRVAKVFNERFKGIRDISHYNAKPLNVSNIPDDILINVVGNFNREFYVSPSFLKKYIIERLPYAVTNPIKEIRFLRDSIVYFMKG